MDTAAPLQGPTVIVASDMPRVMDEFKRDALIKSVSKTLSEFGADPGWAEQFGLFTAWAVDTHAPVPLFGQTEHVTHRDREGWYTCPRCGEKVRDRAGKRELVRHYRQAHPEVGVVDFDIKWEFESPPEPG